MLLPRLQLLKVESFFFGIYHRVRIYLRYLKEHKSKVCLPVVKRLDKEYWGTNVQAIVMALELQNEILKRFVGKQKRNIKYLEYQHSYQKELERLTSKEGISEQFGEHQADRLNIRRQHSKSSIVVVSKSSYLKIWISI
ncbi:unnamed protein product [Nyctereutes procyonoides]|uniref:(raccoon dog) hypothetical protein n=1 Tax=Nyctereutes procyonoides TaxID=34880 RepID=A0A811ZYX8_NYCPR|nr:unnamed protein product [Nyctereutes procyonoides]